MQVSLSPNPVPVMAAPPQSILDGWRFWLVMIVAVIAIGAIYDLVFSYQDARDRVQDLHDHRMSMERDINSVGKLHERTEKVKEATAWWREQTKTVKRPAYLGYFKN